MVTTIIIYLLLIYLSIFSYSHEIKHRIWDLEIQKGRELTIEEKKKLEGEKEFIGVEMIAELIGIYEQEIHFTLKINNYSRTYPTLILIPVKENIRLHIPPATELKPIYYDEVFDKRIEEEVEGKIIFKNVDNRGRRIVTDKIKWIKLIIFNLFRIDTTTLFFPKIRDIEFLFELKKPKKIKIGKVDQLIRKGIKAYKDKKFDEAIEYFNEALKLEPERIDIYNLAAEVYLKKGLIDAAIKILKEAITIAPTYAITHYNLGIAYYTKKEFTNAEISFKQAIAAHEEYTDAYYYLALTYIEQNKPEAAKKELYKLLSIEPDHKEAKELIRKIDYSQ